MSWYTASILIAIKLREGSQEEFPVFENFVLIEANSREEAHEKAEAIAKQEESLDDKLTWNDQPARRVFLGIRKMRAVYNPAPLDADARPDDGTEVSHSYMVVDTEEALEKLASGEEVNVLYVDDA